MYFHILPSYIPYMIGKLGRISSLVEQSLVVRSKQVRFPYLALTFLMRLCLLRV